MAKIAKTFRLEQEIVDDLGKLCEMTGKSATAIVENAIRAYDAAKRGVNTDEKALEVALGQVGRLAADLDRVHGELERTHAELERTHAALERAQDATKAAQALQGAAEQRAIEAEQRALALPDPDEWKKKGLMDRLMKR